MIETFISVFKVINFQILFLTIFLFFIGYAIAPTAYYKKIKWLTIYPFFIIKLMDAFFQKKHHPLKIFFILLILNSISLFVNLLSGWGVILPYLFIIYMGINIGIVMYHTLEGKYYYAGLFNPVAMLELPAAWLSIAMAIQFSLVKFFKVDTLPIINFSSYLGYFFSTIIPLLILAGIIETLLISKTGSGNKSDDAEN